MRHVFVRSLPLLLGTTLALPAFAQTQAELETMETEARNLKERVGKTQDALQRLRDAVAEKHTLPTRLDIVPELDLAGYAVESARYYLDGKPLETPTDAPGPSTSLTAGEHTLLVKLRLKGTSGASAFLRGHAFNLQASHDLVIPADTHVVLQVAASMSEEGDDPRPVITFGSKPL